MCEFNQINLIFLETFYEPSICVFQINLTEPKFILHFKIFLLDIRTHDKKKNEISFNDKFEHVWVNYKIFIGFENLKFTVPAKSIFFVDFFFVKSYI